MEQLIGRSAQTPRKTCVASKLKRAVDVCGAGAGLVALGPLFLLVAAVIKMDSRGPIFFRQHRTGLGGAPFVIYKFRTMYVQDNGRRVVQATKGDPRITRIGALLRRSSIDELPQLINVLLGDMSLVGPRPHARAHDEYYSALIPTYDRRFEAKPGLTGLAQVSGLRGETAQLEQMSARIDYDLAYIEYWSLKMDLNIILQTVIQLPFDPAAY